MLGRKDRDQLELFITGSLRQLVPDEHILARVDLVLDLCWLHDEVADGFLLSTARSTITVGLVRFGSFAKRNGWVTVRRPSAPARRTTAAAIVPSPSPWATTLVSVSNFFMTTSEKIDK